MLRWALTFFIVAIVAGALGFFGLENTAASIAKLFLFGFIVMAVV